MTSREYATNDVDSVRNKLWCPRITRSELLLEKAYLKAGNPFQPFLVLIAYHIHRRIVGWVTARAF